MIPAAVECANNTGEEWRESFDPYLQLWLLYIPISLLFKYVPHAQNAHVGGKALPFECTWTSSGDLW